MLVVATIASASRRAKHLLILFRFGDKNSRPICRRSTYLESLYACPVQIKEHPKAEIVLGRPTQLDRLQRTFPIAASITVNHGRPWLAQFLKAHVACNLFPAQQRVNSFRCGFSFHRNKVDLDHRKFVLGLFPSLRSNENRISVQFCLALKTRSDVYRIAKNRIIEAKVGSEIAD